MNILVFSWRDMKHPLAGGAEQVMHEHMKGWIAGGNNVTFFSSGFDGAKKEENIDGVEIIRKGNQYTAFLCAPFWYLFYKHNNFDLIVDEFHGWPFFTPLYVRKPKIAVIQELAREVWFKYPLPFFLNYIFGAIGYILEPLFFLPYGNVKFITGSKSAKEEVQTVGVKSKNITIVPHGVILDLPKKKFGKEKTNTIVFLGALAKDKGIEDAIKTFGLLGKNYNFWIVGRGDENYLSLLKKLVKESRIEKNTTFFGFVTQQKKFELLSKAHLMVNPSIREGWGLVNIEANACQTPIVSYNSPGLTDSVNDGKSGIIVKKNTPRELAKNIENVLSDKKLYKKLQDGALWWSKQFSWEKSRKLSLALVEEIGIK